MHKWLVYEWDQETHFFDDLVNVLIGVDSYKIQGRYSSFVLFPEEFEWQTWDSPKFFFISL